MFLLGRKKEVSGMFDGSEASIVPTLTEFLDGCMYLEIYHIYRKKQQQQTGMYS